MYQALYRKWRPATFGDVVGQEAIVTALQNQILANRIGHAYLFTGTRGTGKTTCAKVFAKAVNCEDRHGAEPCGQCVACTGIENGSILDVIEIDAASNNSVDDVRDLRDETAYRPSRCRYKVYIIDEVHMLSPSAFNALLKIMEEPPSHVIFILATTELHKVPATVLSRCQRYDFKRIPAEAMARRLAEIAQQENIALSPEAADLIARLADGALRDAISLLDTCAGTGEEVNAELVRRMAGVAGREHLFALSGAVAAQDIAALMGLVAQMRQRSLDAKRLAEELVYHYRNLLLAAEDEEGKLLPNLSAEDRAAYREATAQTDATAAIRAMKRMAAALDRMARSPDPRIELELALIDLASWEAAQGAAAKIPERQKNHAPLPRPSGKAEMPEAKAAPPMGGSAAPGVGRQAVPAIPEEAPVAQRADVGQQAPTEGKPEEEAFETPPSVVAPPSEQGAPKASPVNTGPSQGVGAGKVPAIAPNTLGADHGSGITPLASWPQVVEAMRGIDMLLFSYMKESQAYLQGQRVLIDGSEMFLSYMKQNEDAAARVKDAIRQVTGNRHSIGPYKGGGTMAVPAQLVAETTLEKWAALGIPIEETAGDENG